LGSSHTAPCGAAVPARPPTRSSDITHLHWGPQWVARATRRGTRVVVQRRYATSFPGTSMGNNSCIINTLKRTERPLRALSVQIVLSCAADYEVSYPGPFPPLRNPPRCPVSATTMTTATDSIGAQFVHGFLGTWLRQPAQAVRIQYATPYHAEGPRPRSSHALQETAAFDSVVVVIVQKFILQLACNASSHMFRDTRLETPGSFTMYRRPYLSSLLGGRRG
jgi:hypothetical protein